MATAENLLEVRELKKSYARGGGVFAAGGGARFAAVDGVSFDLARGETLAIVGESGCGKTTLARMVLRLIEADAGEMRFAGENLRAAGGEKLRALRRRMQMVFQDPFASLNPRMRIGEIVGEPLAIHEARLARGERDERVAAMLGRVGLEADAMRRYAHEFSGGQRQRIAIARALAVNPKLLICDEPTSALDVSVQAQILNLLKTLQQQLGLSYLFITHNLAVVEYIAHEVCVMYLGRIVERGSVQEVLHDPQHPYTKALLSAVPRIDGDRGEIIRLSGEMPSPANPPLGCHFHPRCTHAMESCRTVYPAASRINATHMVHCHLYKGIKLGLQPGLYAGHQPARG